MVNVVFALGHRLLNFKSSRVTYFVNASLFIYLVHHPLTLSSGLTSRRISPLTRWASLPGWCLLWGGDRALRNPSADPAPALPFSGKPQTKSLINTRRTQVRRVCFRSPVLVCAGSEAADKDAWCLHRNRQKSPSGIGFSDR
jgi:hypothetical protein